MVVGASDEEQPWFRPFAAPNIEDDLIIDVADLDDIPSLLIDRRHTQNHWLIRKVRRSVGIYRDVVGRVHELVRGSLKVGEFSEVVQPDPLRLQTSCQRMDIIYKGAAPECDLNTRSVGLLLLNLLGGHLHGRRLRKSRRGESCYCRAERERGGERCSDEKSVASSDGDLRVHGVSSLDGE